MPPSRKPTLKEELIGRCAVVGIAAVLAVTATGLLRWGIAALRAAMPYEDRAVTGLPMWAIIASLFLYAGALLLAVLAFRPNDRKKRADPKR